MFFLVMKNAHKEMHTPGKVIEMSQWLIDRSNKNIPNYIFKSFSKETSILKFQKKMSLLLFGVIIYVMWIP